jgi:hypothetical protein
MTFIKSEKELIKEKGKDWRGHCPVWNPAYEMFVGQRIVDKTITSTTVAHQGNLHYKVEIKSQSDRRCISYYYFPVWMIKEV